MKRHALLAFLVAAVAVEVPAGAALITTNFDEDIFIGTDTCSGAQ